MNAQLRQKAVSLRINEHLSYSEIRKRLGVPKSTLCYWLKEFPLSKERILELQQQGWKKSEAKIERFRAAMREKREMKDQSVYLKYIKEFDHLPGTCFLISGLMLYLGEGNKSNYSEINIANTDPKIIKFFIKWLEEFLEIPKDKVRVALHLYENMDIEKEKKFWQDTLELSDSQFYKSSVRKLQKASFSYKGSFRHGTCSLYVMGVEKKRELMMAIKAFVDSYMRI